MSVNDTLRAAVDVPAMSPDPLEAGGVLGLLGPTRAHITSMLAANQCTVAELAGEVGISEVAVRRHLARLAEDGWVQGVVEEPSGRGRPSTRWSLTDRGHDLLPQQYADLAAELLTYMQLQAGEQGLVDYLTWRAARQADRLAHEVDAADIDQRLDQLVDALSAEGSPATVERTREGYVLRQHHCTVFNVARAHPELCHAEAAEFARVLGDGVTARRGSSRADGDKTCECAVVVTGSDVIDSEVAAARQLPVVQP